MDQQSRGAWYAGFAVGGVVVAAVAALLLAIIATARSILGRAERTLATAGQIADATQPVWDLEQTRAAGASLLEQARMIERHADAVADALEAAHGARRK